MRVKLSKRAGICKYCGSQAHFSDQCQEREKDHPLPGLVSKVIIDRDNPSRIARYIIESLDGAGCQAVQRNWKAR